MAMRGNFIDNLPKIYGLYTGGFVVFIGLMALLEQMGVSADTIGILFVGFTVLIYAAIGWLSRTMQVDAYYVAGRSVPPVFNGMATAADWMSGASFVAMAGGIYMGGHAYLAFVVGWTGGYVLVAALMAPYLRKFGCYTVPDFIGTRYGGDVARFCAVLVLVVASFTYVTAQINATGTIASRALHIPFEVGVWFGLLGILLCSMLGGMRAVTWTQVAQYIVLIIAYLVPVIWMSNKQGFGIFPQLVYGEAVMRLGELEAMHQVGVLKPEQAVPGLKALTVPHAAAGTTALESWRFITLVLCMMAGTASLPHILMRYFTTPSVRAARQSVAWSLFLHLPALLHRAGARDVHQAAGARPESRHGHHREDHRGGERSRLGQELERGRLPQGDRLERGRNTPDQRVLHARRHRRAGDSGDRGPALRHLGSGRGRRHGRRDVHRGRPAPRHRQCALA